MTNPNAQYELREACRTITKSLFGRESIGSQKDAKEFRSFIEIWVREMDSIENDLHWKNNK